MVFIIMLFVLFYFNLNYIEYYIIFNLINIYYLFNNLIYGKKIIIYILKIYWFSNNFDILSIISYNIY